MVKNIMNLAISSVDGVYTTMDISCYYFPHLVIEYKVMLSPEILVDDYHILYISTTYNDFRRQGELL